MAKQFASRLSLIAFATASIRGLISDADFVGTVRFALLATAVFYGLGLILGELARRVVEENVDAELARAIEEEASSNAKELPAGLN